MEQRPERQTQLSPGSKKDQEVGAAAHLAEGLSLSLELTFKEKTSSLFPLGCRAILSTTCSSCRQLSWLLGDGAASPALSGVEAPHQQLPDHTRWAGALGLVGRELTATGCAGYCWALTPP